jgi:iron complex transport system substrate-binding protein
VFIERLVLAVRRSYPFAVIVAASALLLASCAAAEESSEQPAGGGEGVTLEHPSIDGLAIDFDAQPENIVMDCYAYSSLHEYGIEPVALFGYECDNPFVMGDADISGIDMVGKDGEIDVEKLAELRPDAIVGQGSAEGWSWFDEDVNAQITRVAPFVPLPGSETIDARIADTREIAAFFGADVEADAIVQSDADLAAAKETFSDAITDSGLNIMLTSPTKEMLYTGVGFAQATLLEELGATIVGDLPGGHPAHRGLQRRLRVHDRAVGRALRGEGRAARSMELEGRHDGDDLRGVAERRRRARLLLDQGCLIAG